MDLIYWLLLLKTPKIGVGRFYQALKYFETPENVITASNKQRKESGVFPQESLDFLLNIDNNIVADDIAWQQQKNCYIITLIDDKYPQKLKQINDPPPILYVCGEIDLLNKQQLAIVGSRNPTIGGMDNAYHFAATLASSIVIVSGMAIGIDKSAHLGALESNNPTIAVCGTGLDRIYPASNKNIARQIATTGALVSELPIGTKPLANNFPRRNRIITGMSDGVLVVEANIKSGSMVSARLSLEQGRDVFAIPGSIKNPLSEGAHHLIKEGAILADSPTVIAESLNLATKFVKNSKEAHISDNVLLKYLDYDGTSFDELVLRSGLSAANISSHLLQLELTGIINKINNNTYALKV